MDILALLKSEVRLTMQLPELVDAFERMCRVPLEAIDAADDLILFETGTFSFAGASVFQFSLVRQVPNAAEEYVQVHLDIQYAPSEINRCLSDCVWNEEIEGDFFAFVRNSKAYLLLQGEKIKEIAVYMDET